MRHSKFLAFNKFHKKIYEVHAIDFHHELITAMSAGLTTHTFGFKDIELMEGTGICDDDEDEYCEIFCGSIAEMVYEGRNIICEVKFETPGFMIVSNELDDGYIWLSELIENDGPHCWLPDSKVIGNIYENPELLEAPHVR